MKITLIEPKISSQTFLKKKLTSKLNIFPTLCLQQLAGNTPKDYQVNIISEIHRPINYNIDSEVIAITCVTPQAPRAYEIADKFRKLGKKVILGGWHPSALPNEAKKHADSVVIGEADYLWKYVLDDIKNKKLKDFYKNDKPIYLNYIQNANRNLSNGISTIGAVQASRGCPMGCEFCAVSNSNFGKIFRRRSIDKVIEELKTIKQKNIWFYDPSLTINPKFTKELFKAMAELDKKFSCFGNIDVLYRDEDLLELAHKAGCQTWFIGIESINQKTINQLGKKSNKVEKYVPSIKKIHDYGQSVIGGFIFGFDNDTQDVFDATKEWIYKLNVDVAEFTNLTPYPGTPLFSRLNNEKRILTYDWSKYTEKGNVVFKPKNMSPEELLNGTNEITREVNSFSGVLKRAMNNKDFFLKTLSKNLLHLI